METKSQNRFSFFFPKKGITQFHFDWSQQEKLKNPYIERQQKKLQLRATSLQWHHFHRRPWSSLISWLLCSSEKSPHQVTLEDKQLNMTHFQFSGMYAKKRERVMCFSSHLTTLWRKTNAPPVQLVVFLYLIVFLFLLPQLCPKLLAFPWWRSARPPA